MSGQFGALNGFFGVGGNVSGYRVVPRQVLVF